jgi:putative transposase
MRQYRRNQEHAKGKANRLTEVEPLIEDFLAGAREDIETFAAELGLTVIRRVMEAEIQKKVGRWGQQPVRRYGQQPGYVIFGGRKVPLQRPRVRSREDKEVELASYKAFQQKGKMQQAVARQLMRQCSSRDYEGAIEGCLKG